MPSEKLSSIVSRRLEKQLLELMCDEPVIVITGPRTVGKSTLLQQVAQHHDRDVIDLDDLSTREVVSSDVTGVTQQHSPVFIDEYQHVPELLDAIKAELNRDTRPGRFVLAGSTRYSALPLTAQSLTGRVHIATMWPLSQGEIGGEEDPFMARLLTNPTAQSRTGISTRADYANRVLAGGLPAALRREPGRARARWYENYIRTVIERDVLQLSDIRQSSVMPMFLRRLAAQTGQLLTIATAAKQTGISPGVGEDYTRLLESVFLIHRLPAWGATLSARVNKTPKVHVMDTGLGGWLMGITERTVNRAIPAVATEFGHLLETFVVNEILKQVSWLDESVTTGHYRTHDGHEVDLVIETFAGDIWAFEVKASGTFRGDDLKGLRQLRDRVGERFQAGHMMFLGEQTGRVDDRLFLTPIDNLWR